MAKTISFLGESSISWYVYDLKTKKYYELDNPSGEAGEEFDDCESMLDKMFEDSLRWLQQWNKDWVVLSQEKYQGYAKTDPKKRRQTAAW